LKIDPPAPSSTPRSRAAKAGAGATTGAEAAERTQQPAPAPGQVHTLPTAPGGGDFDAARVAAIREDIRAGRYEIHPERIASGLLASVRDLLDTKKAP
jgi:negative regulator of flagellin synthesis FlgM